MTGRWLRQMKRLCFRHQIYLFWVDYNFSCRASLGLLVLVWECFHLCSSSWFFFKTVLSGFLMIVLQTNWTCLCSGIMAPTSTNEETVYRMLEISLMVKGLWVRDEEPASNPPNGFMMPLEDYLELPKIDFPLLSSRALSGSILAF